MKNIHYIFFAIMLSAVVCSCKSKPAEPQTDENEAKIEEMANDSLPESDTTAVEEKAFELKMKTYRVVKAAKGCSFTYHAVLPADTDNKAILAIRDDVLGEISDGVDVTADFKRSAVKSVACTRKQLPIPPTSILNTSRSTIWTAFIPCLSRMDLLQWRIMLSTKFQQLRVALRNTII